jgi:hypothetical protein
MADTRFISKAFVRKVTRQRPPLLAIARSALVKMRRVGFDFGNHTEKSLDAAVRLFPACR